MRRRWLVLAVGVALFVPGAARAQDFGVTESAETINRNNVRLEVSPMWVFGKHGGDDAGGVIGMIGYGATDRFDIEGGVDLFDGLTIFGANVEYWLVRNRDVDFSISPGIHFRRSDESFDSTGLDLTFVASRHLTPRLEFYGALDLAFEFAGNDLPDEFNYETVHIVPGLEYRLAEDLDLDVEVGLGLNDHARHYLSGGLSFYFR